MSLAFLLIKRKSKVHNFFIECDDFYKSLLDSLKKKNLLDKTKKLDILFNCF